MSYANKKTRLFLDRGDIKPERRRSESRLKTYPSAVDVRAWCDYVEDRRQHILELITKGTEKCTGKLVPIEALINAILANKNADISNLKKCLAKLWDFIAEINLNENDRQKLCQMRAKMKKICLEPLDKPSTRGLEKNKFDDICPATARHEKERAEVEELVKDAAADDIVGSYKVTTKGPARVTTRIKGLKPGIQLSSGQPTGRITTRAQGSKIVKTTIKNVYPCGKIKNVSPDERNMDENDNDSDEITDDISPAGKINEVPSDKKASPAGKIKEVPSDKRTSPPAGKIKEVPSDKRTSPAGKIKEVPSDKRTSPPAGKIKEVPSDKRTSPAGKIKEVPSDKRTSPSAGKIKEVPSDKRTSPPAGKIKEVPSEKQTSPTGKTNELPSDKKTSVVGKPKEVSSVKKTSPERIVKPDEKIKSIYLDENISNIYPEGKTKDVSNGKKFQFSPEGPQVNNQQFTPIAHSTMIEEPNEGILPDVPFTKEYAVESANTVEDQLTARDVLCNELQNKIDILKEERDRLKAELDASQQELENMKKLNAVTPMSDSSCKEEIEALELEIKVMRSGNLSPEQEAEVIKKEVEMLRKYCMKLKAIENENEKLRGERDALKTGEAILNADSKDDIPQIEELKNKLKNLDDITKERDTLANKVQKLEKELLQYRDLPEDIEVYRDRSKMLDNALEERDKMSKQVEQMKEMENELTQLRRKSSKVDELEKQLKTYDIHDKNTDVELKKTKSRCSCLEKELQNVNKEKDSMCNRIECMKREIESLRYKAKEAEILRLERDRLQIKLNELSHVQVQNENLMVKCRCLESAASERDNYRQKYEEILTMECQCQMLRSQVDTAKCMTRERDALVKQVGDLESCICEQEEEIKKLVLQIDGLTKNKDETQCRMKDALANMRAEVEKKDCLIAASEEKLASVQAQLKSSIQGVSCETLCYKTRIDDLERELSRYQAQVDCLRKQLKEKDNCLKGAKKYTKNECELVGNMKRELEAAKAENKRLQEIANKMVALTGDEHVQKMLKQSECAVKRVVEELGRQYKEWDSMKQRQQKGKFAQVSKECPYKIKRLEIHDLSDSESNDRLKEEMEGIQREKVKLEKLVRQIQENKFTEGAEKEVVTLKIENANLQEQLEKEIKSRKALEKKLNSVIS